MPMRSNVSNFAFNFARWGWYVSMMYFAFLQKQKKKGNRTKFNGKEDKPTTSFKKSTSRIIE